MPGFKEETYKIIYNLMSKLEEIIERLGEEMMVLKSENEALTRILHEVRFKVRN